MDELTDGWINGQMEDGWMIDILMIKEQMDKCWMDERMNGYKWMDGWNDGKCVDC